MDALAEAEALLDADAEALALGEIERLTEGETLEDPALPPMIARNRLPVRVLTQNFPSNSHSPIAVGHQRFLTVCQLPYRVRRSTVCAPIHIDAPIVPITAGPQRTSGPCF